jgi:hypothetical protein
LCAPPTFFVFQEGYQRLDPMKDEHVLTISSIAFFSEKTLIF